MSSLNKYEIKKLFDTYARQHGYSEVPPTIEEFLTESYYIGNSYDFGSKVYPYWKNALVDLFPTPFLENNKKKVILLSGGIAIGKSTVANIIVLYDLARVLCLEKPQELFNLPQAATITFMLTNMTRESVYEINYDPLMTILRDSPFFRSKFNPKRSETTLFVKNINIGVASRYKQLLGKNIFSALSDEVNQEIVLGNNVKLITEMVNRINSRFLMAQNKWYGHYCIISSATTENSIIQKLISDSEEGKGLKKEEIQVFSEPRYIIKKHLGGYSGDIFKVFIGNFTNDPFIIKNDEDLSRAKLIDEDKIFEVPVEHGIEFEQDIYAGIRDVIGQPVGDVRTFIPKKDKIINSMQLPKMFYKDIIFMSSNDDMGIIEYFNTRIIDSFSPGSEKVIAIDIGLSNDNLGIAMGHIHDFKDINSNSDVNYNKRLLNGKTNEYNEYIIYIDFAIAISNKDGEQIPLWKIRQFILDLITDYSLNIKSVLFDGFQSADMIQLLQKNGVNAKLSSVDKKKDAYYALRSAIIEDRLYIPRNELLLKELIYLQESEKKIDHPERLPNGEKGSKDIADAVANVVHELTNMEYNPVNTKEFRKVIMGEDNLYNIMKQQLGVEKEFNFEYI